MTDDVTMCSLTLKLTSFITYSNFWNTDCLIPIYTSEFEISSRRISCSFYPWGEDLYRHSLILGERTYIGTAWWPILLCTYLHNEIFVELKKAKCINVFVLTNNVLYTSTYKNIIKMHEFSAGYLDIVTCWIICILIDKIPLRLMRIDHILKKLFTCKLHFTCKLTVYIILFMCLAINRRETNARRVYAKNILSTL